MPNTTHFDTIIIGGGPAGLQAALTLGRMHRNVLLFDSGQYRNGTVDHAHNYATHDGRDPAEIRRLAREDVAAYETVEIRNASVLSVERQGDGFVVVGDGFTEHAATLVLATGVRDELPDIPGLAEAWGKEVAHCPFCHGHEYAGRRVALHVDGPHAERLNAMLSTIGAELIDVHGKLDKVVRADGGLDLHLSGSGEEDSIEHVDGMFIATQFHQSTPFADQLGLERTEMGGIAVDGFQATSVTGIWAAGDASQHRDMPMPMSSVLTSQAQGLVAGGAIVGYLLSR